MITVVIVLIALIILAVVIGVVVMSARRPALVESGADDFEDGVVSEPVPIAASAAARTANGYRADDILVTQRNEIEADVSAADKGDVRWTKQFEPRSGLLSDEDRLRLINDLGMLGSQWCIPLLKAAGEQEIDPAHRVAVQLALARCRGAEAVR